MAKVGPNEGENSSPVNFTDRDPKVIHSKEDFQVDFHEIFAEPDPGVHSFDWAWKASYLSFSYTRLWTYRILSICGVISACCFGCKFACTACYTIWCCWPCLKLCAVCVLPVRKCLFICLDAFIGPLIHAISMLLYNIRVVIVKNSGV